MTRFGARHLDDGLEIGERPERLHPDDRVGGAAREYLERAVRAARGGVHQQLTREAGLKPGQLPDEPALHRPALERVEVGDVAGHGAEHVAVRPGKRERVAGMLRRDRRLHRRVRRAVAALRVHGDTSYDIDHGNDVHALLHDR